MDDASAGVDAEVASSFRKATGALTLLARPRPWPPHVVDETTSGDGESVKGLLSN